MRLVSPNEHQLLVFWTQLLLLLVFARGLGQLMRRMGQPAIIGELGAGLLLGPSVLGKISPSALDWLLPVDRTQAGMLTAVGWIGILMLMIVTGFETDLTLIRRLGRPAALVSTMSLLIPLSAGAATGALMPDVFVGDLNERPAFVLFVAAALGISSLAVVGKILSELGLLRRNLGQVTLAAGMSNDLAGWIILGIIAGIATAGEVTIGPVVLTVVGMALFIAVSLTFGQRVLDRMLRELRRRDAGLTAYVTAIVGAALFAGVLTQWLGVEAVLGAFVAGILLGRSRVQEPHAREVVEAATVGVFAPIFFGLAGLRVDLGLLGEAEVFRWAILVVAVAMVTKFVGAYVGARMARLPRFEGIALGFSLNARGTLEIVIATIGLSLGVFSREAYTVVMLMAVSASMLSPPLLRFVARRWEGTLEEQERLRREESMARNVVVRNDRLLLPSRGGPNSIVAAQVVHLAWPDEVEATVLSVGSGDRPAGLDVMEDLLHERPHELRDVRSEDAARAVLEEAALGYGVIAVGAQDAAPGGGLLSPLAERLLSATPIPVVIVRRSRLLEGPLPSAFARALVPVAGTTASRAAQEVAFGLSTRIGTEIVLVHVLPADAGGDGAAAAAAAVEGAAVEGAAVDADSGSIASHWPTALVNRVVPRFHARDRLAMQVISDASQLAAEVGARVVTTIREGVSTPAEIIAAAEESEADLVVLGAGIRKVQDRPFLGHTVEQVLAECPTTVVVVATPQRAERG